MQTAERPSFARALRQRSVLAIALVWAVGVACFAALRGLDQRRQDQQHALQLAQAALGGADRMDRLPDATLLQQFVALHPRLMAAVCLTPDGQVVGAFPSSAAPLGTDLPRPQDPPSRISFAVEGASCAAWRVLLPLVGRDGALVACVRADDRASAWLSHTLTFAGVTLLAGWMGGALFAAWVERKVRAIFHDLSRLARFALDADDQYAPSSAFEETCSLRHDIGHGAAALTEAKGRIDQLEKEMHRVLHHREKAMARNLEKTRRQSLTDPLTGLYNRRFLDEELPKILGDIEKREGDVTMVMIDLDFFKQLNDSSGHEAGDELLRFVGDLLRGATRESDYCIRYGGDEFAIVMPHTPEDQALRAVERILKLFSQYAAVLKTTPRVSMSAGLACSAARSPDDRRQLLTLADRALYQSKSLGRNRVTVAA